MWTHPLTRLSVHSVTHVNKNRTTFFCEPKLTALWAGMRNKKQLAQKSSRHHLVWRCGVCKLLPFEAQVFSALPTVSHFYFLSWIGSCAIFSRQMCPFVGMLSESMRFLRSHAPPPTQPLPKKTLGTSFDGLVVFDGQV